MLEFPAAPRRVRRRGHASGPTTDAGDVLKPHVIGSRDCFGRVAEWQTRWLQVPVSFGTWGFKSPFAHDER